jgi:hypothetical protein
MRVPNYRLPGAFAIALALVCSCSSPYPDPQAGKGGSGSQGGGGAEAESLFVSSTDSSGAAAVYFRTSDAAYISDNGYTLWSLKAADQSPFVSRTVVLNKQSGDPGAGFGIVFCRHGASSIADETMLVAMIDTEQEYIVGEAIGSSFTAIVPWTSSPYLKRGYNQANAMSVSLDRMTRVFTLFINGERVKTFSAIEPGYDLSGGNGYIAVISPRDDFPTTPVCIAYIEQ